MGDFIGDKALQQQKAREKTPEIQARIKALIEKDPLYKKLQTDLVQSIESLYPPKVLLHCQVCKAEVPFHDTLGNNEKCLPNHSQQRMETGVYPYIYRCTGCDSYFYCFIEANYEENWVRKVGQAPPRDINLSKDIERQLGDSAFLYKRALICIEHSFGIAACIYLRRVIEDQIDPLLSIHLETRKSEGADQKEIDAIESAISSKIFDDKIKIISRNIPGAVPQAANNPITIMYDRLSDGIHRRSDNECIEVAQKVRFMLIRLLVELKKEQDAKKEYLENLKALSRE